MRYGPKLEENTSAAEPPPASSVTVSPPRQTVRTQVIDPAKEPMYTPGAPDGAHQKIADAPKGSSWWDWVVESLFGGGEAPVKSDGRDLVSEALGANGTMDGTGGFKDDPRIDILEKPVYNSEQSKPAFPGGQQNAPAEAPGQTYPPLGTQTSISDTVAQTSAGINNQAKPSAAANTGEGTPNPQQKATIDSSNGKPAVAPGSQAGDQDIGSSMQRRLKGADGADVNEQVRPKVNRPASVADDMASTMMADDKGFDFQGAIESGFGRLPGNRSTDVVPKTGPIKFGGGGNIGGAVKGIFGGGGIGGLF